MGLRHTTERNGVTDAFDDTENCLGYRSWNDCPDRVNLMFPFSSNIAENLSKGQVQRLSESPWSK